MLNSKVGLVQEMEELEHIKDMYKKAFPEHPVWKELTKKKRGPKGEASGTT